MMYEKIAPILTYFTRIGYFVESTGVSVKTESQTELLHLYNSARATVRLSPVERPGLHHKLKTSSPAFRRHLLYCLGLDELGFGPSLWDNSPQKIISDIKIAIEGGLLSILSAHSAASNLLTVNHNKEQGIAKNDPLAALQTKLRTETIVIEEEKGLTLTANLPFAGYLRILALEEGEVFGLNEELDLPIEILDAGTYSDLLPIELTRTISRTTLIALACQDDELRQWPSGLDQKNRLDAQNAASMASKFIELNSAERAIKVISVITA